MQGMDGVNTPKIIEQTSPTQVSPKQKLSMLIAKKKGVTPNETNENNTKTIKDVSPKTIKDLTSQLDPQNPLARKESFIVKLGVNTSPTPVKISNFTKPLLQPDSKNLEDQKGIDVRKLKYGELENLSSEQLELVAKDATPTLKFMLKTKTPGTYKKSLPALAKEVWAELYEKHDGGKLWLFMGSRLGGYKPELFQFLTVLQDIEKSVRKNPKEALALYRQFKLNLVGQAPSDKTNMANMNINLTRGRIEEIRGMIDLFINENESKLGNLESKLQKLEEMLADELEIIASTLENLEAETDNKLIKLISLEEFKLKKELNTAGSSKRVIIEDKLKMLSDSRSNAKKNMIEFLEVDMVKLRYLKQKEATKIEKDTRTTIDKLVDDFAADVCRFNVKLLLETIKKENPFDGVDTISFPNFENAIKKYG